MRVKDVTRRFAQIDADLYRRGITLRSGRKMDARERRAKNGERGNGSPSCNPAESLCARSGGKLHSSPHLKLNMLGSICRSDIYDAQGFYPNVRRSHID